MLGPTRGYRIHPHNAMVIDLHAEGMWPSSSTLDFTIITPVIGLLTRTPIGR